MRDGVRIHARLSSSLWRSSGWCRRRAHLEEEPGSFAGPTETNQGRAVVLLRVHAVQEGRGSHVRLVGGESWRFLFRPLAAEPAECDPALVERESFRRDGCAWIQFGASCGRGAVKASPPLNSSLLPHISDCFYLLLADRRGRHGVLCMPLRHAFSSLVGDHAACVLSSDRKNEGAA